MKKAFSVLRSVIYVAAGCALFSVSVNMFSLPNEIVQGGLTGIAIMLESLFPFIPVGAAVFSMNIPLFILGYFRLGRAFILKTAAASAAFAFAVDSGAALIPEYRGDPFLASVFCGVCAGAGIALILLAGATTGGTETAALLIKQKKPNFSVGRLILFIDLAVLAVSYFVFKSFESTMYAVVTLW